MESKSTAIEVVDGAIFDDKFAAIGGVRDEDFVAEREIALVVEATGEFCKVEAKPDGDAIGSVGPLVEDCSVDLRGGTSTLLAAPAVKDEASVEELRSSFHAKGEVVPTLRERGLCEDTAVGIGCCMEPQSGIGSFADECLLLSLVRNVEDFRVGRGRPNGWVDERRLWIDVVRVPVGQTSTLGMIVERSVDAVSLVRLL